MVELPKKQQQCLIPRYLLKYLEDLQITHTDPTESWGSSYTAGTGIKITDNTISVNSTVVALKSDLSDYVTSSELITELSNYVTSTDLATELLNYAELDDIPTATSDLTNDSGYITSSALVGYATETWVTNQGYLVQSDLTNYVTSTDLVSELLNYAELSDLATVATSGSYNDLIDKPTIPVVPTNISAFTNDAGYITSSALIGYATETWVTNQGYSTFSGDYNDLTNKPTIPTVPTNVSAFTNDAGYITSSDLTDYVTTNTAQSISGVKTFVGNTLAFKNDTNNTSGFKIYNQNDTEIGSLKVATTSLIPSILLSNASSSLVKSYIGFRVQPNGSSNNYKFVMPYAYNSDFQSAGYSTTGETVFPFIFTDGTTNVKANGTGVVDLSSLNLGGTTYTAGTGIDITNDVISVDSTVVALKSDIPTVPTNVSAFTNDAGYITGITSSDVTTALGYTPGTSNFSGDYDDLTDKPSIPSSATSTSTSTVTPSTIQLTFTFEDDTTQTVTLMTGATVSTTTTTTLS